MHAPRPRQPCRGALPEPNAPKSGGFSTRTQCAGQWRAALAESRPSGRRRPSSRRRCRSCRGGPSRGARASCGRCLQPARLLAQQQQQTALGAAQQQRRERRRRRPPLPLLRRRRRRARPRRHPQWTCGRAWRLATLRSCVYCIERPLLLLLLLLKRRGGGARCPTPAIHYCVAEEDRAWCGVPCA